MGLIEQIFPGGPADARHLQLFARPRRGLRSCPFWKCVRRHRSIACERHKLTPPVIRHVRTMQMRRALTSMIVNGRV